jgi:hypothetical protein
MKYIHVFLFGGPIWACLDPDLDPVSQSGSGYRPADPQLNFGPNQDLDLKHCLVWLTKTEGIFCFTISVLGTGGKKSVESMQVICDFKNIGYVHGHQEIKRS